MRYVSLWKSGISRYFFSILEGICCLSIGSLLIIELLMLGNIPAQMMIWLMHFLWSIGAFMASRRAGLHGRKYGMLTGFLCSFLLCLFLIAGNFTLHETFSKRLLVRCFLMFPAGIAGGIIGVNTKLRKPPY